MTHLSRSIIGMLPLLSATALAVATILPSALPQSPGWSGSATWPVRPAVVTAGFDPPSQRWNAGHRGIDLAASPGQTVASAAAGSVAFAGDVAGRGVVVVSHGELRTTYEPVASVVAVGEWVGTGEPIGTIETGTGHCGDGSCLHWGLLRGQTYLDPRLLLGLRPILKPP